MNTQTITVAHNKSHMELEPVRMSIYRQSKVLEAMDAKQQYYYLFFYKDTFLNGVKATKCNIDSHVHKAFINGILFPADHPLTQALLNQSQSFHFQRFNQLFKRIQQKFNPQETALIFTFFDSFVPTKEIKKLLKNTFYHYRRNGQMLASYRILHIYVEYDPEDSFGHDLIYGMQFRKYEDIYENLDQLAQKDPLYLESVCFDHLHDSPYTSYLLSLLNNEGRWIDELAIRIASLSTTTTSENLTEIQTMAHEHFDETEQISLLTYMVGLYPNVRELKKDLLEKLLHQNDHAEIVRFVVSNSLSPSEHELSQVKNSFLTAPLDVFPPLFDQLNNRLLELFKDDLNMLERISIRSVSSFLRIYSLKQVKEWLLPFNQAGLHLPIEQKLDKMLLLEEDPDHQLELGELYLYFEQLEKSLDCFKWEMELHPNDRKPVQYLSKIYHDLGKKEEAKAYQQLLVQMEKTS